MRKTVQKTIRLYRCAYSGIPRQAWLLASAILINRCGTMVLFFLSLYLTRHLGFSAVRAGQLVGLWGLGSIAGSYGGGWLSDRWGTKTVLVASMALGGIGFFVMGFTTRPAVLSVLLLLQGAIGEAFRPANIAAYTEVCPPEKRARAYSLDRLANNAGLAIGPALGGCLASSNPRLLFWIDGATNLAAACFLVFAIRIRSLVKKPPGLHSSESGLSGRDKSPWRDKPFLFLLALTFVIGLLFFQILNTWPLYLREHGKLTEAQIGLALAMNAVLIVLFEMPLIYKLEKREHLGVISAGVLFLFTGFFLLPFGSGFAYTAAAVLIWTLGEMLTLPMTGAVVASMAGESNRGRYMGLYTLSFSVAMCVGPPLGAWIYESAGKDALWLASGPAGLVVWAGFRRLKAKKERPAKNRYAASANGKDNGYPSEKAYLDMDQAGQDEA
jgi:MFS family permease